MIIIKNRNSFTLLQFSTKNHSEFILAEPKLGRKTEWYLGDYLTRLTIVPRDKMKCVVHILKHVCSTKNLFLDSEKSHVPQILGTYFKFASIDQRLKIQVKSEKP